MDLLLLMNKDEASSKVPALYDFSAGLPSGASFARASTATYLSAATGYLATAAIDEARFEKGCLLIEPQRTNYAGNSNDFTGAVNGLTVTSSNATSPDGTVDASKLTIWSSTLVHNVNKSPVISSAGSCLSCYIKPGTWNYAFIRILAGSSVYATGVIDLTTGLFTEFKTSNGAIINGYGVENIGNGWYRVYIDAKNFGSGSWCAVGFAEKATGNTFDAINGYPSFYGDGASYLYVFGYGFEYTSTGLKKATSYIPTGATSVTRAADQLTLNIPANLSMIQIVFDDASTQDIDVSAYAGGTYTLNPTILNRYHIRRIIKI